MSRYQQCGNLVVSRIHSVASEPKELSPYGRAALAKLRRGVGKEPGTVPEIWGLTLDGLGDQRGLAAQRRENAVHVALTQWALHQQSKQASMHSSARSFGEALRLLALTQKSPDQGLHDTPAYRRMMALASSRTLPGITTHARGLISQLRSTDIGFDYGRWADDLYWIQVPSRTASVQRQWGRDFYRLRDEDVVDQRDAIKSPATEENEEA